MRISLCALFFFIYVYNYIIYSSYILHIPWSTHNYMYLYYFEIDENQRKSLHTRFAEYVALGPVFTVKKGCHLRRLSVPQPWKKLGRGNIGTCTLYWMVKE